MRFRWYLVASRLGILGLAVLCSTCGGKSGGVAAAIACSLLSASVNGSSLTVGLSQALLGQLQTGLNFTDDTEVLNTRIKDALNGALEAASVSSQLNIKTVTAVPKEAGADDGVRFLELGGNLAAGVTFASSLLKLPAVQDALSTSFRLADGKAFDFVEDSFRVSKSGRISPDQSNDSTRQWAYDQTKVDEALTVADALPNARDQVVVAVLDTGVSLDHPALKDNIFTENGAVKGYDFANNDSSADDDEGHGTHCAGIIAAKKVDESGVVGVGELVAPGKVKIMPIKVLSKKGGGSTDAINKGIRYAMAEGAHVISMSLGGGVDFQNLVASNGTESQIIRDAVNAGIIVVVAAGNENCPLGGNCRQQTLFVLSQTIEEYTVLPCSYNGTICVGASDPNATLAPYSNYPSSLTKGIDPNVVDPATKRTSPDITAPGSAIYSTYIDNRYKSLDGTSMAAPYVAGLAAIFQLKAAADKRNTDGTPQKTFRRLLQESELALATEEGETRSYVGQVDLNHFMKKIRELNTGTLAGTPPTLQAVDEPAGEETGEAPNALAAICGG
ncbi:MAG TPA: S8 family serine peptidase [Oligoflexus sp.]|uniref:S8 family serine peptidase n=1 Tax=Oligoflexus sp. TaxID=1971216 RepID=UPI002D6126DE|nr:S8 family serine peptidase [Oligoflexus sp.]HYX31523.1 S8 family serine peptidase [Oligoflexus sp.]